MFVTPRDSAFGKPAENIFIIYNVIPLARVIIGDISRVVWKQLLNTVFFLNIIVLPFECKYDIHFLFNSFHAICHLCLKYPWKWVFKPF